MAINSETLRLSEETRNALLGISDGHINQLVAAWVTQWDLLGVEFETALDDLMLGAKDGRISKAAASRSKRLASALVLAHERLTELADSVGVIVGEDLGEALRRAYAGQAAMIGSQLPAGQTALIVGADRITAAPADAMVKRTLDQIHKYTRPIPDDVVDLMKAELVRGIALGDSPKTTARRIVRRAEGRFNGGGLTRAMSIARTEFLDAHRSASQLADQDNADIMAGWRWGASLSARTCPSCLANHGTLHPISEPGPIDHHQGRCDRIPVTKSWAELGFPDVNEPADILPDAREWFDNLTAGTQKEIMGSERLKLLQSGQVRWEDLTRRSSNGDWRDSMTVTPLAVLRARVGELQEYVAP